MKYFISNNERLLIHVSSGKLMREKKFIHDRRRLDTFVFIICIKGKLHIVQDDIKYTLTENQYLILFADHEHYGFRESEGELLYYWCHFELPDNDYLILEEKEKGSIFEKDVSKLYILPEHGDITTNGRATMIFHQLLDIARNNCYSTKLTNCALSLLAMEITQEYVENNKPVNTEKEHNPNMEYVIEWVRINYNRNLTIKKIAKYFSYNPEYLSTVFKKYQGLPLMKYITTVRIAKAKNFLVNSDEGIKEIAWKVGFRDEKTFMKRFKKLEDITPTKYRNAFSRAKIVKN
jgi:AraC-like DNA-binding protein